MANTLPSTPKLSPSEIVRINQLIDLELAGEDSTSCQDNDVHLCFSALNKSSIVSSGLIGGGESVRALSGRFTQPRFVGCGAFGVVFLVKDNTLGLDVAIKLLRPSRNSPVVQQRFLEEAKITASLHHAGIVRLFDSGLIENLPYITSAIARRGSLTDLIATNPSGIAHMQAVQIMAQVADAVAYAHSKLTYHRDLKPGNVLLDADVDENDLKPIITDFGLAKRWDHTDAALTLDGDILGTAQYMSPEQASGNLDEYSVASEVFALGIIFYEMLTGRTPFEGSNKMEVRKAIVQAQPVSLIKRNPNVSRELASIVHKCLQKPIEHRYESVVAVAKDLKRFLAGEPVEASQPSLIRLIQWKSSQHPWVTSALATATLAILLSIGGISWSWWQQNQSAKRESQTKIAYIVLLGELVDDVVAGEKDQQQAILESLAGFEQNLKKDREANPDDMTLQHLLSLVYHYKSITLRRVGRISDAAEARVCSIELLRDLRTRFPSREMFRFQCLNGMATFSEYVSHQDVSNHIEMYLNRLGCQNTDGFVNDVLAECDAIQSTSSNLSYIDACHHFRHLTASLLLPRDPVRAQNEFEKVIADAKALAEKHSDTPTYVKPALHALAVLTSEFSVRHDYQAASEFSARSSLLFETFLKQHFDKPWVQAFFLETSRTRLNLLFEQRQFAEAVSLANQCLDVLPNVSESAHQILSRTSRFHVCAVKYLALLELGSAQNAQAALDELRQATIAACEVERSKAECQNLCTAFKLPQTITSILNSDSK